MSTPFPSGVIAPNLTPFNDDGSVALDLYVDHAIRLLEGHCVALAPFGTTGEALSVGIEERIEALDALVSAGVDPKRLVPGTGLTNLPDTLRLTRHAASLGCAGAMILPPFYFKGPTEEGLFSYFEQLIAKISDTPIGIYLYHIPQMAGVGFPLSLVKRLKHSFPKEIVGIKDSSGVWENTEGLLSIDDLIVFPGSELPLAEALALGASGCISATANINSGSIAELIKKLTTQDDVDELTKSVKAFRLLLQDYAPIPAQKGLLALTTGDNRWRNVRPPLLPANEQSSMELQEKLQSEFGFQV